jgi:hypothetical protein
LFRVNHEPVLKPDLRKCETASSGVPERMVGDLGLAGQPREVELEPEISELGLAVPWPVAVSEGLDGRTELLK